MTDELPPGNQAGNTGSGDVDWGKTLALLTERIAKDPRDADAWTSRGLLRGRLHDYEGAACDFKEALSLDPNSLHALWWEGDLYRELGRYSEALASYNRAIAIAPTNARGYHHRGDCYIKQGCPAEAISDFTRAITLEPDWPQPYLDRAQARSCESVADNTGALADYDAFLRLEHTCVELITLAHGLRAFAYVELGLYREAISDFDAKFALAPGYAADYLTRSRLHKMVGDTVRAAEDHKKAMELERKEVEREGDTSNS
jgi:Tfp pilus assembly protein PilF